MRLTSNRQIRAIRTLGVCLAWMALVVAALGESVSTTTVQGTVYLADGRPGSGTLQISWPAFTTASNQTVAAGKTTANVGADGFLSVNLAPNLGSSPAGLYYTVVYHLSDGTTSTEYWVVPMAAQASIAQVRSQVMPAAQAVQAVNKAYVDQAIQSLVQGNLTSTGGQLTGPLYLNGDPTQALQAADKHYVDTSFAQALPLTGGTATGPLTASQLGAAYQVDQFPGADFGAKLQACIAAVNSTYGGTCDARNFSGTLSASANLTIASANTTVLLPCATISTARQIVVTAGTRNVSLRGCSLRGASQASGSQGGTVLLYTGTGAAIQVGDSAYAIDTLGFHLENVLINTTGSASATAQAFTAYRTQELDLEGLFLLGNANQIGMTLDGTGNYTGGTFYDTHISGFKTAIDGVGHQITNSVATDWLNASTFVRLHVDCPTAGGNPISGTYGINLLQGDGNTFTGGDVENCSTALHLGPNAQNNTIIGLRNENSTYQVVADPGSSYNSWMTGGTMLTGKLTDNGTRNSFLDTFHRSFNSLNGDWYGSQQDTTLTNHFRLGTGNGNERGLLNRYQTDYGYRWTMGLSDATGGEQFYQLLDELNNVNRISVGQFNSGQASTDNQTLINSAGSGAVVLNGSNNAGTGGVVFGSGGTNETTVATVSNSGNAQFNGTLQVGGTAQSAGTMTVRNNADSGVDYYLWPGLTTSQKGSFTYKDYNGNSQWAMVKDANNNWALNSAVGGLDSFKAYQSTNSGDTYVNASSATGVVRVNYETGSGSAFNIYGGNSNNLYASFSGNSSIKLPGLSASSGHNCVQVDSSGYLSNTGVACGTGTDFILGGDVGGISGAQVVQGLKGYGVPAPAVGALTWTGSAYQWSPPAGMVYPPSGIPGSSGSGWNGTSYTTNGSGTTLALSNSPHFTTPDIGAATGTSLTASVNSQIYVKAPPYNAVCDGVTDDHTAIQAAFNDALTYNKPVQFPAGTCLTSTITGYLGQSFFGAGTLLTRLQGKAGQDVIQGPNASGTVYRQNAYIHDISIIVDSSVNKSATAAGGDNTFPDRISGTSGGGGTAGAIVPLTNPPAIGPYVFGPTQSDGCSITAGTPTLTCSSGDVEWVSYGSGLVGLPITVTGAGAGGGVLTTTVAAYVNPTTLTLAANASTTVASNASGTIGSAIAPPWYFGNCGIAMPESNGAWNYGANGMTLKNVAFGSINQPYPRANHTCGMFVQAQWYAANLEGVSATGLFGGIIEGLPVTGSGPYAWSPDTNTYKDLNLAFNSLPLVTYNGGSRVFNGINIYGGEQMFTAGLFQLAPNGQGGNEETTINGIFFECFAPNSGENSRYQGVVTISAGGSLDGCGTSYVAWYANQSVVNSVNIGRLNIYGNANVFHNVGSNLTLSDYGNDNSVDVAVYNSNNRRFYANRPREPLNKLDAGFLLSGNSATPFTSGSDLIVTCAEMNFAFNNGTGTGPGCTNDPTGTEITHSYVHLTSALYAGGWQMTGSGTSQGQGPLGKYLVIGDRLPRAKTTFVSIAKCNVSCSHALQIFDNTTSTTLANISVTYGTGWTVQTFTVDLSGTSVGDLIGVQVPSGSGLWSSGMTDEYLALYAFAPQNADVLNAVVSTINSTLAAPPAIGSTTPAAGTFTNLAATGTFNGASSNTFSSSTASVNLDCITTFSTGSCFTSHQASSGQYAADQIYFGGTRYWLYGGLAGQGNNFVWQSSQHSNHNVLTLNAANDAVTTFNNTLDDGSGNALFSNPAGSVAVNINGTGSAHLTLKGAATHGYLTLNPANNSSVGAVEIISGSTTLWRAGLLGTGANNYDIRDMVNAHTFVSFPQGMPANSIGGNTNGATAITQSAADNSVNIATDAFVKANLPLSGTSGSIGGSSLTAGSCASGTVTVAGATTSMAAVVSPAGTNPGAGFTWRAYVSSSGTVTVQVCAVVAGTPSATTYNVRVIQ